MLFRGIDLSAAVPVADPTLSAAILAPGMIRRHEGLMPGRFRRGGAVYAKDGRRYVVEDIEDGIVYCTADNGAEAGFPESALSNETEWAGRTDGRRDLAYTKLKQARIYTQPSAALDRKASEETLAKAERLEPGLLDFAAFTVATRALTEAGDAGLVAGLSITRCREIFDAARVDIRAGLLANLLDAPPQAFVGAGRLGDNLMRALLQKGLAAHEAAFDAFRDRRRR